MTQLPSLKQLKVRLRSGLLSFFFLCNVCRKRHHSEDDLHLIGQWEESTSQHKSLVSLTYKGIKLHVFYLNNIFQSEKEVPGAQGQPHHKVTNLEEPASKALSALNDVPPSFTSYEKHPEIF